MMRIVASGPAASLLAVFFIAIPAAMSLPPALAVLTISIAGLSLLNFLLSLIPFRSRTCDSDGKQLLDLWLKRPAAEASLASARLLGQFEKQFDGNDLDASLIDILSKQGIDPMARFNGNFFAAIRASGQKDLKAVAMHTHRMADDFEQLPRPIQSDLAWAITTFAARCGEIDKARKYFELIPASSKLPWYEDYLKARIAISEGDGNSAAQHLVNLRRKIDSPVYSEKWKKAVSREIDEIEAESRSFPLVDGSSQQVPESA
jgi:hypothetical protein